MRTWTLSEKRQPWSTEAGIRVKLEDEPSFADETLYRVVESDGLAVLLERWLQDDSNDLTLTADTEAWLRALT